MKDYKVGDTVYLKAFVANVDKSDPEKTYGVNFVRGNYVIQAWPDCEAIIDELPVAEPVMPVLPKDVADELEDYKITGFDLVDYFSAFNERADDVENSNKYAYDNTDEINSQRVANLANAWCNGYTIEKESECQIISGAELMRTAIDDWNAFPDNDETLFDWYPELAKVLPDKKYKVWPMLEFEEAGE